MVGGTVAARQRVADCAVGGDWDVGGAAGAGGDWGCGCEGGEGEERHDGR